MKHRKFPYVSLTIVSFSQEKNKQILTLMILDMISILKVSSVYAMIPPGIEVELEPELTGTVTVKLNESVDGLPLA